MDRDKLLNLLRLAKSNKVSLSEIEPNRKGATISALLKGKKNINKCTDAKIQEIQSNTIRLLNEKGIDCNSYSFTDTAVTTSNTNTNMDIEKRVLQLEKEVEKIKVQNRELLEMLELKKNVPVIKDNRCTANDSVMGFTLQKRRDYWYAGKCINGKLKWIYIGKDKENAESKITEWLQNKFSNKKE